MLHFHYEVLTQNNRGLFFILKAIAHMSSLLDKSYHLFSGHSPIPASKTSNLMLIYANLFKMVV